MLKFDNTHIFTGYIKQLLSSVNLPTYKIYTKERPIFPSTATTTNIYINDDQYYYQDEKALWHLISDERYWFNKKTLNKSKSLQIQNTLYDTKTHEFLGEYLRYLRDYANLDLMPLYNCFSNNLLNSPRINKLYFGTGKSSKEISLIDPSYKIYIIPVKFFQKYTIAIDSASPVEIFCGFWSKYISSNTSINYAYSVNYQKIIEKTYTKINRCYFNQPFIFDALTKNITISKAGLAKLGKYEENLKLFIKLPIHTESSITILEGNYLNWNDIIFDDELVPHTNHLVTNFYTEEQIDFPNDCTRTKVIMRETFPEFRPIGPLQLLKINTGTSYPFADRLIEYLLGNTITNMDEIGDNVVRLQKVLETDLPAASRSDYYKNTQFTGNFDSLQYHIMPGLWDDAYRPVLYNYMQGLPIQKKSKLTWLHDSLGYVDKDVEKFYKSTNLNTQQELSLNSVDIYDQLYNKGGYK